MSTEQPTQAAAAARRRINLPAFTSRLWFKNSAAAVVALLALASAIPLSVYDREDYQDYRASRIPARTIEPGTSATIDGQVWTLGSVRQFGRSPAAHRAAPKGTAITVVQITRTGGASHSVRCTAYLIDGDRRWQAEDAYGSDFWVPPPDDRTTGSCDKPGSLQFSFLVPDDARPSAVDLVDLDRRIEVRVKL